MVAVPDVAPVVNLTVTRPFEVRASAGSIVPIVVVKLTTVPFWTGVPAAAELDVPVPVPVPVPLLVPFSMSTATTSTELLSATASLTTVRLMTVPVGARRGTLSQEASVAARARAVTGRSGRRNRCMRDAREDNTFMRSSQSDAQGFAMAVLLIVMAITAVWMTAALPTWKQQSIREKEAELVFRGQQFQRAFRLYNQKFPGASPQNLDVLVDNKVLRRKYKDPMTGEDFVPLYGGNQLGVPGGGQAQPGMPPASPQQPAGGARPGGAGTPQGPGQGGALIGVASKSTAPSILIYNGATHYNEWQFTFTAPSPQQGGPAGGGRPGGAPAGGRPGGASGGPAIGGPRGGGPAGPGGPGRGGQAPAGPGRGGAAPATTGRGRGGH